MGSNWSKRWDGQGKCKISFGWQVFVCVTPKCFQTRFWFRLNMLYSPNLFLISCYKLGVSVQDQCLLIIIQKYCAMFSFCPWEVSWSILCLLSCDYYYYYFSIRLLLLLLLFSVYEEESRFYQFKVDIYFFVQLFWYPLSRMVYT